MTNQEDKPHYLQHRERLRLKFRENNALADYELLELILFNAIPRKDVKPIAKDLIKVFGNVAKVFRADIDELVKVKGVGYNVATALKAIEQAALVMLEKEAKQEGSVMRNWAHVIQYCRAKMGYQDVEHFRVLYLNSKNEILLDEEQSKGTIDKTAVYPREILKKAVDISASSVILVHNHPSGDATPSKADIDITNTIRQALQTVGITLHDHIIVSSTGESSFVDLGLITRELK
jgi:DNA repair protein RadC